MEGNLLSFMDNASPWWWLSLGVGLLLLEMVTFSFFLIWPGLAAVFTALVLWLMPDLAGVWQITIFAICGVIFTFVGRAWVRRRGQPESDRPMLNRRSARLIGRQGQVVDTEPNGECRIEIDGVVWKARLKTETTEPAPQVTVVAVDGLTLIVAPQAV